MKKKMLLVLVCIAITFGLFYLTHELLTEPFKWWTIPTLAVGWIVGIMGMMLLFDLTTDSDDSKGEEDKRKGHWPKEAE